MKWAFKVKKNKEHHPAKIISLALPPAKITIVVTVSPFSKTKNNKVVSEI